MTSLMKWLAVLPLATLVVACGSRTDVAWFKDHPDERDAKIAECRTVAGAFDNNQACINAVMAEDVRALSYWSENPEDRKAKLVECKEHRATIGHSPNCENAGRAATAAFGGGGNAVYVGK